MKKLIVLCTALFVVSTGFGQEIGVVIDLSAPGTIKYGFAGNWEPEGTMSASVFDSSGNIISGVFEQKMTQIYNQLDIRSYESSNIVVLPLPKNTAANRLTLARVFFGTLDVMYLCPATDFRLKMDFGDDVFSGASFLEASGIGEFARMTWEEYEGSGASYINDPGRGVGYQ